MATNEELRNEIAKLRRAATKKISRLKQVKNVVTSGSKVDPRRDPAVHKKYNNEQLENYKNMLQGFVSRKTQYVPDSQHRPIHADKFKEYKQLETEYNARVDQHFSKFQDYVLPSSETILERMAKMTPDHKRAWNPPVNSPFRATVRQSKAMASDKALETLIDKMNERLTPDYFDKLNRAGMEQFEQMESVINDKGLSNKVKQLTPGQFALLWNYTNFAAAVSMHYETMMKMLSNQEKPWHTTVRRDAIADYEEMVEWASKQKA